MCGQLDLWPETLSTPEKELDNRIDIYMSMWRADRSTATLAHMNLLIDERLQLERRNNA